MMNNRFRTLLMAGALLMSALPAHAELKRYYGDINRDGVLDIADVILLQKTVLGFPPPNYDPKVADVNCDTKIDEKDVKLLSDIVLGKQQPTEIDDGNHDIEVKDDTGTFD